MALISFDENKKRDVVLIGRVTLDFNPNELNRTLDKVKTFSMYLGGSPGNIAVGINKLGKNVGFIELGDGSAFRSVQVVYEHGEIPESVSKFFATGTAITVKGVLELTPEAKQSFEIKANEVIIEGECPND